MRGRDFLASTKDDDDMTAPKQEDAFRLRRNDFRKSPGLGIGALLLRAGLVLLVMYLVLLGIFELFSIRGRFLGYLIDGCFILAFLFLLITPEPLGPTWYRKLYQKKRRKHQATERPE